jgi:hypothetical protein
MKRIVRLFLLAAALSIIGSCNLGGDPGDDGGGNNRDNR